MNKKSIKEHILLKRKSLNEDFIKNSSKQIFSNFLKFQNFSNSQVVAGYYPVNNEVDDFLILNYLLANNFSVALPSISDTKVLSFKKYSDNLIDGNFNIKEPNTSEILLPNIILAPLVAFDKKGNRLGYGGGYYDSTLNYYKSIGHKVLYVGLAYFFQEVEKIDINNFDIPLDAIINEKEYKYFDRR